MNQKQTAIVRDQDVRQYLDDAWTDLEIYRERNYEERDFIRSAMIAITESFQLKKCLQTDEGKRSLYHALKFAASTGLSLNPQQGKAALIAYSGKVQYQVMKDGLIDLAMATGQVETVTCDLVRKNDVFKIMKGARSDDYQFEPALTKRGPVIGYFASVVLKPTEAQPQGAIRVHYMTAEETIEHAEKYSSNYRWALWAQKHGTADEKKSAEKAPWIVSFDGMSVKTAVKMLFHRLYLAEDDKERFAMIHTAIKAEDGSEHGTDPIDVFPVAEHKGATAADVSKRLEAQKEDPAEAADEDPDRVQPGDLFE